MQAARVGIREREFWRMLPRELAALVKAQDERERRQDDRFIMLANHWRPRNKRLKPASKPKTQIHDAPSQAEWEHAKEQLRQRERNG